MTFHVFVVSFRYGAIQVLHVMQWGVSGMSNFYGKKCYTVVWFNVISVMKGWVGVNFPENKALPETLIAPFVTFQFKSY